MSAPVRIQLSRKKGWQMPANTVSVARGPGRKWGNPFRVGVHGDARECVRRYRHLCAGLIDRLTQPAPAYADQSASLDAVRNDIEELRGRNLACWCPLDAPCHADVLLKLANREGSK